MKIIAARQDALVERIEGEFAHKRQQLEHQLVRECEGTLSPKQFADTEELILLGQHSLNSHTRELALRVERLDAAMCARRIGMYGLCADCEETIPLYDLEIDPAEPRCFECRCKHLHNEMQW
uniref:TraR/DksA C4-type zinc finger protein n=1 Tax=Thaumasiovibrio occultus TaxID=1891184 RepID=UPI000B35765F|nr:TraR/DksA C4-type zinc finger protein [Thaumasiovibrio occultus]